MAAAIVQYTEETGAVVFDASALVVPAADAAVAGVAAGMLLFVLWSGTKVVYYFVSDVLERRRVDAMWANSVPASEAREK